MISLSKWHHVRQSYGIPETIVKDYTVEYLLNGAVVDKKDICGNHQRLNDVKSDVVCDTVRITVNKTHGCNTARICEIRIY